MLERPSLNHVIRISNNSNDDHKTPTGGFMATADLIDPPSKAFPMTIVSKRYIDTVYIAAISTRCVQIVT